MFQTLTCFLFLFYYLLRWAPSIMSTSQTSARFSKSMAHWLPQQQTWTHVCLTDSYKKETGIQIGLHCLTERARTCIIDNHDTNPSLILENPVSIVPPGSPLFPHVLLLNIGRYRHAWNSHFVRLSRHGFGLRCFRGQFDNGRSIEAKACQWLCCLLIANVVRA